MDLKYAVIGTGALGGFYGGMLANAGKDVHFLFHNDYDYVSQNGLRIDSTFGNFIIQHPNAYDSTSKMPVCDVILVCLKTTNNKMLTELLPPLLHKDTCVILVQNGLGIEAALAQNFPDMSIAGGLAFICSSKVGLGHITQMDYGKLTIGSYQGDNKSVLQQVCSDLSDAGVPNVISDDLTMSRWKKLVWNIPYNGMCVVLDTTTERLMQYSDTYELIRALMLEVIGAANACGVHVDENFAQAMLDSTLKMKPYAPSMKLDYDYRRPLEIQAIYTNPLITAQKAGYDMPKVNMLEQQLKYIQEGYLKH